MCVNDIQDILQKQFNIDDFSVSEFCKTQNVDFETDIDHFLPEISAFNIPDSLYGILLELKTYKASFVFDKMWNDGCKGYQEGVRTIDDIVQKRWIPIKERLDNFVISYCMKNTLAKYASKLLKSKCSLI